MGKEYHNVLSLPLPPRPPSPQAKDIGLVNELVQWYLPDAAAMDGIFAINETYRDSQLAYDLRGMLGVRPCPPIEGTRFVLVAVFGVIRKVRGHSFCHCPRVCPAPWKARYSTCHIDPRGLLRR